MDKFRAVQKMIQMLQTENPPLFVVMFRPGNGYEIAGQQHEKLHLTVSAHHTPFIRQTEEGFECISLFPAGANNNAGIWDPELSDDSVKTYLNVTLQSIARIDGAIEDEPGKFLTLYEEPLVMDEKTQYRAVFSSIASLLWL